MRHIYIIHLILLLNVTHVISQKPILQDFHADPSIHKWDGKFWIYPSHDIAGSDWWNMVDWHCFSSNDLVNWTDHGVIFSLDNVSWAEKWAWAPDCMKYNDKYYFYFTADDQIGVAISENPFGPFKDTLGKPLIEKGEGETRVMDPAIFIDDDEEIYLYFGQNAARVVKLNKDMISRKGEIINLEVQNFHEGAWMHKKDSIYYLSYPSYMGDLTANLLEYSISNSPLGPFEYKGVILDNRSRNVHHSIIDIEDQWYLFYHIQGPSPYERQVCAEYLYYNEDGTIKPIEMTKEGISAIPAH
ncbi:family 43 glycosylhydrolase [Bacteroidota bacterium]